ncbi:MAG: TetR/AcrR family transcriptional regulator [Patulibacter minatonensis]
MPSADDDPATPRRADAARNREAVVAAAFEVLSRQPDASMQDIASASGLGRTTVYRHFPNREALIVALFEHVYADSQEAIVAILAEHDTPADVLPRLAALTVGLGDRYSFLSAHRELANDFLRQPREDPMRDWIERGMATGTLRPLGITWVQGMVLGLISAAHEEYFEGRETLEDAARKLGETLLAAFALPAGR